MAAEFSGSGAEVEEMVGGTDDVGVVFDDEDGVAEVAEVLHDADELGGVSSVEADAGLVEDVEACDEREPSEVASWMRWDSPPERVELRRSRVR